MKKTKAQPSPAAPTRGKGRPAKAPEDRALTKTYSISPAQWAEVEEWIPEGERSRIIQEALRRAVVRRKKEAAITPEQEAEGYARSAEFTVWEGETP